MSDFNVKKSSWDPTLAKERAVQRELLGTVGLPVSSTDGPRMARRCTSRGRGCSKSPLPKNMGVELDRQIPCASYKYADANDVASWFNSLFIALLSLIDSLSILRLWQTSSTRIRCCKLKAL